MAAQLLLYTCLAVAFVGIPCTAQPKYMRTPMGRAACGVDLVDCQKFCDKTDRVPVCDQYGRFFRNKCEFTNVQCLHCNLQMKQATMANGGFTCSSRPASRAGGGPHARDISGSTGFNIFGIPIFGVGAGVQGGNPGDPIAPPAPYWG